MEPALLGLVLDSSVLVAAERGRLTTPEAIRRIREAVGDIPIVICALTVAELAHGIYRADTPERSHQRLGCPEVSAQVLMDWVATWVEAGGATLDLPTKYEVTDGGY